MAPRHIDIPADSSSHEECTGSFVLAVPGLPGPVGLTAAHCNSTDRAPVERGFAGTDPERPPQLGLGPVYLEPGLGLSTRAVGIVTGLVPRGFRLRQILVSTPIEPVLAALHATLPPGPTVRGPIAAAPGGGF